MNLKKIIENESKRWVAGGIIEQEQAQKILGLYPEKKINGFNWGTLIFSSIGGIIFGLGVILFFSYNWDKLHRLFKLALILSALLSAEIIAFYIKFKKEKTALSEGIFALGTMFFGGGIWLVAQVYNIDEHYPNGFFIWGLGALLMGWALHSSVQGIIASSIFSLWCGIEAFEFSYSPHIVFPLILLGIVPLALRKESILLFAIAIFSFLICLLFVGIKLFEIYLYLVFISVGAMFIALSVLLKASIFSRDKSK
ncbi:MAG TPA: DUF2157 domain-containing protein, partial [Victivallales bacterium]|nr:DUF2157 domain-containing protein [Victivallales bacterium]